MATASSSTVCQHQEENPSSTRHCSCILPGRSARRRPIIAELALVMPASRRPVKAWRVLHYLTTRNAGQEPPANWLLPITLPAFALTEKSASTSRPGHRHRVNQMIRKTTDKSAACVWAYFNQIRAIKDEELEHVWAGKKTAKEALDTAQ